MSNPAARKGDTDDFGHTITSGTVAGVTIDGAPAAVKGSAMDDGVAITSGVSSTVRINGSYAAVKGSVTEPHTPGPGKNQPGTINSGSSTVFIG